MRTALAWLALAVLCCAAAASGAQAPPDAARAAYERARQLHARGRYSEALSQGERALALWEAATQGTPPEAAGCLDLLGVLHQLQGDAAGAESLLRRALALRETTLGKSHPDVASSLDHLASLYKDQGAYEHAAPLYERALAIQEAALGKDHPEVAGVLNNLAGLLAEQGLYARAEPLYRRAFALQEVALGKDHPEVAATLGNLADLYLSLGDHQKAVPLALRALLSQEKSLGRNHPAIVSTLDTIARVRVRQGNLELAEKVYLRALELVEETQGRNHPRVAELLNGLARVRLLGGRTGDALPPLRRAFAITELRLRREALDFSESRLSGFVARLRAQDDLIYELARVAPHIEGVGHLALTVALLRKGRSVEQLAETSRTAYQRVSAQDREALAKLRRLRSELAGLSHQGPGALPPADYRQRLNELARQGDALEAELARRSAPLRALSSLPLPEDMVDQVADALDSGSVLIEYVAYMDRGSLRYPGARKPPPAPKLRYLALVLRPDARTHVVDLGEAALIDSVATKLRDALARRDADFLVTTQELYLRALRPVWQYLRRSEKVYLSADGQLGLVPFAALHDGQQFLVDAYDFTYLNSGRDLLPRSKQGVPSWSVVVLADPDFQAPASPPDKAAPEEASALASVERSLSQVRADVAELPWTPLPGTRAEAEAIQRMLPRAKLFLGREATKARLLQVSAPGVLHLATHGFFLEDAEAAPSTRAVTHFGALSEPSRAAAPEDPLLRSGLILAGTGDGEGPVVTALELAGLNLWGTQLVVLSACDTGRGDVKLGQGVYGLRRAFVAAGAETVVMSLWKVDDAVTKVLMEGYYRNLLDGRGRATALRGAMRALRTARPHPHYWAPFIAVGQDAPLRLLTTALPLVK